jgi:hypothetical protein
MIDDQMPEHWVNQPEIITIDFVAVDDGIGLGRANGRAYSTMSGGVLGMPKRIYLHAVAISPTMGVDFKFFIFRFFSSSQFISVSSSL